MAGFEFNEKEVDSYLFTLYLYEEKIRCIIVKRLHFTIMKLLVLIMLSGDWKICQMF